MRLFVALEIPRTVRDNLAGLLEAFRVITNEPRWVRPAHLHVTLKFLGEVADAKLEGVRAVLRGIHFEEVVALGFRSLGFFPNEKQPRVFWAGIEASPSLKTLAAGIDAAMENVGIPREGREFSPHLTLARFERVRLPEALRSAIAANAQREFGSLRTGEFHLIHSKLKPSGAEYTTLESFRFAPGAD